MKTSSLSARTWYVLLQVYKKAFIERRTPKKYEHMHQRRWNLTYAEQLFESYDAVCLERYVKKGVER